ncbi:MAG: hypothetical protein ACE5EU_00440 [Paracoccaceae bacterium]
MRKAITVLAVTAATLFATAALPQNTDLEESAERQRTIDRIQARAAARNGLLPRIFGGIRLGFTDPGRAERGSDYGRNLRPKYNDPVEFWPGTFRAGGNQGPAGR